MNERKRWKVQYDHKDGRKGTVNVVTEIEKRDNDYGNVKYGLLIIEGSLVHYDLRYATGDLHRVLITDYFGKGLVSAELI